MRKFTIAFSLSGKCLILFLLFLTITSLSYAQVRLIHDQIFQAEENKPIELMVQVDGEFTSGDEMRVYYRVSGEDSYEYIILDNIGNEFRGRLPAFPFSADKIEYFFSFIKGSEIITLPVSDPYFNPFSIQITPRSDTPATIETPTVTPQASQDLSDEDYLVLGPEPGEKVAPEDVFIAVSVFLDASAFDSTRSQLYLDGSIVVAEITSDLITYAPAFLPVGAHTIQVNLFDANGNPYKPIQWNFQVTGTQAAVARGTTVSRPSSKIMSGSVFIESKVDKYSGNDRNNHQIGARIRGNSGKIKYGSRVYLTSLEDKVFQPRHRFLFWVETGIVNLYVGDTSPRFSQLMLWGKRVRGFEAQLNLKFINFDFVMGKVNRSISPGTTSSGTFERNLRGLRTSFGSGKNFQFGLSAVKVKDDVESISGGLRPKDNVIGGADLLISLFKNRFRWKTEIAVSLLTDDISSGPLSKQDIEDLIDTDVGFDPADYEDILIINLSTTPLDPTDFTSGAYSSSIQIRAARHNFRIKYKSIGAAYNSLANSFLKSNVRGLKISDRVRLFKNRVYLNLSYENYDDNFKAEDNNPTIALRTFRGGVNLFPGNGLPNLTVNFKSYNRDNKITATKFINNVEFDNREDNTTKDITVSLSHDFLLFDLDNTINISYVTMDKNDVFVNSRLGSSLPIGINNDIQSFSLKTKFRQPLTTRISYSENKNNSIGGLSQFKFKMLNLRAEYKALQNKLTLYAGYGRFEAEGGTGALSPQADVLVIDYTKNNLNFGGRIDVSAKSALVFDGTIIDYSDNGGITDSNGQFTQNNSFKDRTFRIRFESRF